MARKNNEDRGLFEKVPGSGVWSVEWYDHNGKRRRHQVGKKSKARQYRHNVKALVKAVQDGDKPASELVRQGYLPPNAIGKEKELTLGEFIRDCSPELSQLKSWKDIRRYADKWTKLIGDLPLGEVSANHARKQRTARLAKGAAPATCNREIEFLRSILNRALDQDLIEKNPLAKFKDLPEDNERVRALTGGEEGRLAAEMTLEEFDPVAVAMDTGLRRAKVFGMAWVDVDLERGWITVKKAKAGSSRQVPMTNRVRDILTRRYAQRKGHFVFPNSTGTKPMDSNNFVNRVFKPALERAGIEDFRWHDLRHTFASRLASAGKGGRVLTELLGHKNTKTTDRYAHLDPETFRAAVDVLNDDQGKGGLRVVK